MKKLILIALSCVAFGAHAKNQYRCEAYCLRTAIVPLIDGVSYTTILNSGAMRADGYTPYEAFKNLAKFCQQTSGNKLLADYQYMQNSNNINDYEFGSMPVIPPGAKLLIQQVPASLENCHQLSAISSKKPLVDQEGNLLLNQQNETNAVK